MLAVSSRLIFVWFLFVIVVTTAPFDFRKLGDVPGPALQGFHDGNDQESPLHFGLNLLLFVPFGALLHHKGRRRGIRARSIIVAGAATAFAVSVSIEYVQVFLPDRISSLVDVVANTAGAVIGVVAYTAGGAGRIGGSRFRRQSWSQAL